MTDTNTETQPISAEDEIVNNEVKKPSKIPFIIAIICLLFCLFIIGFGYYFYKNNLVTDVDYKQEIETLATEFKSQAEQQNSQYQSNQAVTDDLKTQIEQLSIQLLDEQNKSKLYSADMQNIQRSLAEKNIRHPSDWILTEVEYLINLSGRKLWLEHDLNSSIALLSTADQRIVEIGDPSLNPLRRALLEDINMLEAIPKRDVDSVVLTLSSLEQRIDKLVITGLEVPETAKDDNQEFEDLDSRESRIRRFKEDPNCMVLVANPAAAAESISLHEQCNYALYLDRTYNAGQFLQSQDRIHRLIAKDKEQQKYIEVFMLDLPWCADWRVHQALNRKIDNMAQFLNDGSLRSLEGFDVDSDSLNHDNPMDAIDEEEFNIR